MKTPEFSKFIFVEDHCCFRCYGQKNTIKTSCARGDTMSPPCPLYARCGPPPVYSLHALCLRHLAPWIFMIDRQRLALGGGVETGLVDIHYVVIWTANQSGLVTLTFWPWKWCPSHLGYLRANFGLPRPLCSQLRPDVHDRRQTDRHQTKASLNAAHLLGVGHNKHKCLVCSSKLNDQNTLHICIDHFSYLSSNEHYSCTTVWYARCHSSSLFVSILWHYLLNAPWQNSVNSTLHLYVCCP